MRPIDDPRPFFEVLRDWIGRHGGSNYAAARLLHTSQPTIARWVSGRPCTTEQAQRALMTLIDEGRT